MRRAKKSVRNKNIIKNKVANDSVDLEKQINKVNKVNKLDKEAYIRQLQNERNNQRRNISKNEKVVVIDQNKARDTYPEIKKEYDPDPTPVSFFSQKFVVCSFITSLVAGAIMALIVFALSDHARGKKAFYSGLISFIVSEILHCFVRYLVLSCFFEL